MNHLKTLKAYQAWRRDDTKEPRTLNEMGLSAMAIGEALDWAISECEAANELRANVERLRESLIHMTAGTTWYLEGPYGAPPELEDLQDARKTLTETPEQSLAEIRAEAVERAVSKTPEHKMKVDNRIYHSQGALLDFAAAIRQEADL